LKVTQGHQQCCQSILAGATRQTIILSNYVPIYLSIYVCVSAKYSTADLGSADFDKTCQVRPS